MTVEILTRERAPSATAAVLVILRAAAGLLAHGLVRPGQLATIDRNSGRVTPR